MNNEKKVFINELCEKLRTLNKNWVDRDKSIIITNNIKNYLNYINKFKIN